MARNLVSTGMMAEDEAQRLRAIMEREFPEAQVTGYEHLVAATKNHEKDRHVAAAAVKAGAQVITTANLKDFAELPEGIEAQSPDVFLCNLFDLDPEGFVELLREQADDLVNPRVGAGSSGRDGPRVRAHEARELAVAPPSRVVDSKKAVAHELPQGSALRTCFEPPPRGARRTW
jgi:hypothetical protein